MKVRLLPVPVNTRLQPVNHVEPLSDTAHGLWRSVGNDPVFRLLPPPGRRRHPGGWVRLRLDLRQIEAGDIAPHPGIDASTIDRPKLNPLLYVDDGKGFREEIAIPLAVGDRGIDDLVRLPPRVTALRLDPMSAAGTFALSSCRIDSLSLPAALAEIGRRLIGSLPEEERAWRAYAPKALRFAREAGPARAWRTFLDSARPRPAPPAYQAWIETVETPGRLGVAAMRAEIAGFRRRPLISIVMPVYDTPAVWLEAAIASIKAQAYENWELCLCDDHSPAPHIRPMLDAFVAGDRRIKLHRRTTNGRISLATNDAMALATGEYMTLMDHDDAIPDNALYEFARILDAEPEVDFIYSDEDKISVDGIRYQPFFKPDWSPEALEGCMYTAHLALYRMDIVRRVGGFRDACNGAQDYDFVLRYTEHVRHVRHVPKVLYHWRAIPGSTAQSMDNKSYVIDAAIRGLEDRARRTGELDFVRPGAYKGSFELRRRIRGRPLVSIVIPTAGRDSVIGGRSVDLVAACVESIRSLTTYDAVEIVAVDNGDLRASTAAALDRHGVRTVTYAEPVFNVAAKMNLGARAARGEALVFLNDDIAVITPDWIEAMLSVLQIEGVGAVGAKLLFETGEIQHAGVSVLEAGPDHIRRGYPGDDPGHFFSTVSNRNYLAVTGACMMVERDTFMRLGGFDEAYAVNYNDVDLCLRIWEEGRRIVYCAQAQLYHYESRNRARTVDPAESDRFRRRWRPLLPRDPYYGEWFQAEPPTFELDPVRF